MANNIIELRDGAGNILLPSTVGEAVWVGNKHLSEYIFDLSTNLFGDIFDISSGIPDDIFDISTKLTGDIFDLSTSL